MIPAYIQITYLLTEVLVKLLTLVKFQEKAICYYLYRTLYSSEIWDIIKTYETFLQLCISLLMQKDAIDHKSERREEVKRHYNKIFVVFKHVKRKYFRLILLLY